MTPNLKSRSATTLALAAASLSVLALLTFDFAKPVTKIQPAWVLYFAANLVIALIVALVSFAEVPVNLIVESALPIITGTLFFLMALTTWFRVRR